jgi:hypothetical protein
MVSVRILKSTSLAIQTIEATLANLDPYNHDFPEEPNHSIRNCDFPDQVEDPFAIIRLLRGDAFAKELEYEDHIDVILCILSTCFSEELRRKGLSADDLDDYVTTDEEPDSVDR